MIADGKWTCSTNDEHWTTSEEFDTREQALTYAQQFAVDNDVEPGAWIYVGQIVKITQDDLAKESVDAWRVIDEIEQWLYDNVGSETAIDLHVQKAAEQDLDARLRACVKQWLVDHKIEALCWRIEHVTSVVVDASAVLCTQGGE